MIEFAQQAAEAAAQAAPATGPTLIEMVMAIAAAISAIFGYLQQRKAAAAKADKAKAEAERDATILGADKATERLDNTTAAQVRKDLREEQERAGVQPDVSKRLDELRKEKS